MNKIENLSEHGMLACSVRAGVPADGRLVILQDNVDGFVETIGVRYIDGRWIGESSKADLTAQITDSAIWTESYLFLPSSMSPEDYADHLRVASVSLKPAQASA